MSLSESETIDEEKSACQRERRGKQDLDAPPSTNDPRMKRAVVFL
jgi:hypothetical protein